MDTPRAKERRIIQFARLCLFVFLAALLFRFAWDATTVSSQLTWMLVGFALLLFVVFDLRYSSRKPPHTLVNVLLLKESENDEFVDYRFGPSEEQFGLVRLVKASGEVLELESTLATDPDRFLMVASAKVRQYWRQNSFPETTTFTALQYSLGEP